MSQPQAQDATEKFVSLIKRHAVLSRTPLLDGSKPDIDGAFETITCHNDTDLFVASMNCVRHARINDLFTNYTLLNLENDFMVQSLVLNALGSLLAVVGKTQVVIVALPAFYGHHFDTNFASCSKSYPMGVKKVIWHPASYLNRSLVVLTDDSRLFHVDATSNESCEAHIDLGGRGILPQSLAFGNPKTLNGSLTLYIADASSSVYAIFPFVRHNSQILATESQVDHAIQEARDILEWNESNFQFSGIVDSFNSSLQRRLILHYHFLEHLKAQFKSTHPLPADVRLDSNGVAREYFGLELPPTPDVAAVQGPLCRLLEGLSLIDMATFCTKGNATFLALCTMTSAGAVNIQYFAQTNPLLMQWHICAESKLFEQPLLSSIAPRNKSSKIYKLPRHGFGFVDTAPNAQDSLIRKQLTEKQRMRNLAIREQKFVEINYESLTFINEDKIHSKNSNAVSSRLHVFGSDLEKISLYFNGRVLLFDSSRMADWCLQSMNSGLKMGEVPCPDVLMPLVCNDIRSLIYLNDVVGDTGDYLVYTKASGTDGAEVIHITPNVQYTIPESESAPETAADIEDVDQDELTRKLSELTKHLESNSGPQGAELKQNLKYLKGLSVTVGDLGAGQENILSDPIKSLAAVETLSTSTVQKILNFTGYAINLQSKFRSQLLVFKKELEVLSKLLDSQVDSKKIDEYQDRMKVLAQRLETVNAKISSLESKLRDSLRKINAEKPLPLSAAEKAWFQELNAISDHLKNDSANRPSLANTVGSLQGQAKIIIEEICLTDNDTKVKTPAEILEDMKLRDQFMCFAGKLHDEEKLIGLVKRKLDECFEGLEIRG